MSSCLRLVSRVQHSTETPGTPIRLKPGDGQQVECVDAGGSLLLADSADEGYSVAARAGRETRAHKIVQHAHRSECGSPLLYPLTGTRACVCALQAGPVE